jgi:mRNA interferase HigB
MRVISKRRLREFWERHADAERPLRTWWKTAVAGTWRSIREVRATFPQADAVAAAGGLVLTVFNIAGNKYRLITRIVYAYGRIYVRAVLTHREYDAGDWKVRP